MRVSDILRVKGDMLFTITPEDSLADAARIMSEKDIGSLVEGSVGFPTQVPDHEHERSCVFALYAFACAGNGSLDTISIRYQGAVKLVDAV